MRGTRINQELNRISRMLCWVPHISFWVAGGPHMLLRVPQVRIFGPGIRAEGAGAFRLLKTAIRSMGL
jgi:hypothetical protein